MNELIEKRISPSMICMDLCNLEQGIRELEAAGCKQLHVDILDGYFSPSMPIGLDIVRQLRKKTDLCFDAHIMAMDCSFIMEQLANIGVERLCFQVETERHISRKLSWLKEHGIKAGVALAPATPISSLEYVLEQCDFVLLMMINPGFASNSNEKPLASLEKKISDLHEMIEIKGYHTTITIDGRTYLEVIPKYMKLGADTFVAGTSSLFRKNGKSVKENFEILKTAIENEEKNR